MRIKLEFGWEFPELGISREIAPFLELGFPGKMFGNFGKFGKFFAVKNAIFNGFKRFKSDAKPNFLKNSYVLDSVRSIQTFSIGFLSVELLIIQNTCYLPKYVS